MRNQKGFSLVELLIVVAIIGIIAAIAIPSLLAARRAANESAAIGSLRTLGSAEATGLSLDGTYENMATMSGKGYVDTAWVSGVVRDGYKFAETGTYTTGTFGFTAVPNTAGDGVRGFGVYQDYVIRATAGGTAAAITDTPIGTAAAGS